MERTRRGRCEAAASAGKADVMDGRRERRYGRRPIFLFSPPEIRDVRSLLVSDSNAKRDARVSDFRLIET
jgi:hypothetical protein